MPSTPQTSGFRASVMPTFQGADPRLFNPYGALATGLQSGVDMASKIQEGQLRSEQQARLAEQAAYEQTQRAGLEEARRLQNAAAERALDQPTWGYGEKSEAVYGNPVSVAQTDSAGNQIYGPDGLPLLKQTQGPAIGEVTIKEGRDRFGKPIFSRVEMSQEAYAARKAAEDDRKERLRLESERVALQRDKDQKEWKLQDGYLVNSITGQVKKVPGWEPVLSPTERALNMLLADKIPGGAGQGGGAGASLNYSNNLPNPAPVDGGDFRFYNNTPTRLVEPVIDVPVGSTAPAGIASNYASPKTLAEYNKLPPGTEYLNPATGVIKRKP